MISVYLISSLLNNEKVYKIGITRRDINKRIKEFKTGNCSELKLENSFVSPWGFKIENYFHRLYRLKSLGGEWFKLDKNDVENFTPICEKLHSNFEFLETYSIKEKNK